MVSFPAGRHDDMVDGPAFPEKAGNAFIAGDIGRNACRADLVGSRLQALGIARSDHDLGALVPGKLGSGKTNAG